MAPWWRLCLELCFRRPLPVLAAPGLQAVGGGRVRDAARRRGGGGGGGGRRRRRLQVVAGFRRDEDDVIIHGGGALHPASLVSDLLEERLHLRAHLGHPVELHACPRQEEEHA